MWQIGVTVANATVLGDVMMPSRDSARAATLMKRAKLPKGSGGLILVDSRCCSETTVIDFYDLLFDSDPRQVRLTLSRNAAKGIDAHEFCELVAMDGAEDLSLVVPHRLCS